MSTSRFAILVAVLTFGAAMASVAPNIRTHACMKANVTGLPFCNTSLTFEARANDLVNRMTMDEKVCFLSTPSCKQGAPRLGLPTYNWGVEDLHGAGTACLKDPVDGSMHCPTIFPTLATLAATFNETAWQGMGTVIGTEMRAANNAGANRSRHATPPGEPDGNPPIGVNGWGPNLNIARDPRWGRNSEVPSEDSFLAGKVGAAMTKGIQGDPKAKYVLCLGALKHVTAYSLENWEDDTGGPHHGTKYSRFGFNGNVSRHDLAETYLEQYRIAISESNALGMMCSYSAINGTASCENPHLLANWARKSMNFEGNVVTDCGALGMSSEPKDPATSAAAAMNAGTDINCGHVYEHGIAQAVQAGTVSQDTLNKSVYRSIFLLMRAGYFDPVDMNPYSSILPSAVGSKASHDLAKEIALQGMVLLKNEKAALPFDSAKTTAVLGPLANATLDLVSRYYDAVCPGPLHDKLPWSKGERASGCIASPVARISARGKVLHASGSVCPHDIPGNHCIGSTDTSNFTAALDAAKAADQIVMFVGTDHGVESEGRDRQSLTLVGAQAELIAAVRKAEPSKPLVVVLLNGGMISMDYSQADAVVEAFFPGIEGAEAIACALFGESGCNKWGRLPVTIFPETFVQNDMANMGISTGGSGLRTYKYYDNSFGEPHFQFGEGLSYVNFSVAWNGQPSSTIVSPSSSVTISVTVKNLGSREGDIVVLMFHRPQKSKLVGLLSGMPIPTRRLVGYKRLSLAAGQSANAEFVVGAEELALVDSNGDTQLFEGQHDIEVSQGSGTSLSQAFNVKTTAMLRQLEW